jgi:Tfp pilus assembly protein PilX
MIDMRHLTTFKRRLTGEAGFVLPTALIVLLILTLLTGAAITVATQTSTSTTRDDNTKAALEAAEAGLHTASYRLSKLEPAKAECITGTQKETPSLAYCASSGSEPLGNGATFEYWTTKGLAEGERCGGETISAQEYVTQRCITSLGTVNGVQRRVQARAALNRPPLFETDGIFGYNSVSIKQGSEFNGAIGTNRTVTLTSGDTVEEVVLGPSGKLVGAAGAGEYPFGAKKVNTVKNEFVRARVPIGESAESAKETAECGTPSPTDEAAGKNCDLQIPVTKNGEVEFNEATRALTLKKNNANLVLKGGIYNFCSLEVQGNGSTIKTTANERVEIFIDSAKREGSKCTTSQVPAAGTLSFAKNAVALENPTHNATFLQIYVYDGSGGTIEIKNNSTSEFWGTLVAPYSNLIIGNGAHFTGAIIASELELENLFHFTWEGKIKELLRETTAYERKAWEECPPTHTGTNPQEGC